MPRDLSPDALDYLVNNKEQLVDCCILEVKWNKTGNSYFYGEKKLDGIANLNGLILDIQSLDTTINLDSSSDSAYCTITLSDISGDIKNILDTTDIYNSPVILYQWFDKISYSSKFPLVIGSIAAPITWNEYDRKLTFSVISRLNSREVGFSIEDGDLPNGYPESLIGQAWPMGFGTPINGKTLLLNPIPQLSTAFGFGFKDPAIPFQMQFIQDDISNLNEQIQLCGFYIGVANAQGDEATAERLTSQLQEITDERDRMQEDLNNLMKLNLEQVKAEGSPGGRINGMQEYGNTRITARVVMNGYKFSFAAANGVGGFQIEPDNRPKAEVDSVNQIIKSSPGFVYFQPGSQIQIIDGFPLTYVYNIIPSTILDVRAYRLINGRRSVVKLPKGSWKATTVNLGSVVGYAVQLKGPLSQLTYQAFDPITGQMAEQSFNYEDEIFVTYQSSVGPNVAAIIQYLIETYTDLTVDSTSFSQVASQTANYPCNFVLMDRPDAVEICREICYQARCAMYIKNNVVYLKYLPNEADPTDTLTRDDILTESLEITTTEDSEIITKMSATWIADYAQPKTNKVILRYNVQRFGNRESDRDYFIYNNVQLVIKSMTYWLIQSGNVWKKAKFNLPINKLNIDTFDTIEIDEPHIGQTNALVESSAYNLQTRQVEVVIWTPILLGTKTPNPLGWPSQISTQVIYPKPEDIVTGNATGYNPAVPRPSGTLPGTQINYVFPEGGGTIAEHTPTDIDDTVPEPRPVDEVQVPPPAAVPGRFVYIPPKKFTVEGNTSEIYPCRVVEHVSGSTYKVMIYPDKTKNKGPVVEATQLQVASGWTFPANIWGICIRQIDAEDQEHFYMQLPVWIK